MSKSIIVVKDPENFVIDEVKSCVYNVRSTLASELPDWSRMSDGIEIASVANPLAIRKVVYDILSSLEETNTVIVVNLPGHPIWARTLDALGATFVTSEEVDTAVKICETEVPGLHLDSGICIMEL